MATGKRYQAWSYSRPEKIEGKQRAVAHEYFREQRILRGARSMRRHVDEQPRPSQFHEQMFSVGGRIEIQSGLAEGAFDFIGLDPNRRQRLRCHREDRAGSPSLDSITVGSRVHILRIGNHPNGVRLPNISSGIVAQGHERNLVERSVGDDDDFLSRKFRHQRCEQGAMQALQNGIGRPRRPLALANAEHRLFADEIQFPQQGMQFRLGHPEFDKRRIPRRGAKRPDSTVYDQIVEQGLTRFQPFDDVAFGFGGNTKEPSAMRGGPMFELLFGVETWLRQQGKRDKFNLTFFNAAAEPGKRLGEKAVKNLLVEMQRRGVTTHLGEKILGFDERSVKTENATLPADLILFMPGLTGPAWAAQSGVELSPGGFFPADEYCAVKGCDKVFVAGDAGSYPGPDWLPKQAHMADLQAQAAAENLALALAGKPPFAKPRPELICIVDSVDTGMLVYRDTKRSMMLPSSKVFHWAKRYFETHYLRAFR